ncbi:MAG: hypothetical protein ACKOE6_04315 [Flammeovirgaceae bacterium]
MARLEDIPKKQAFKVPDGYFDALPMRIQSRIDAQKQAERPAFSFGRVALRYALPVVAIAILSVVWLTQRPGTEVDPLAALNQVSAQELVAFLEDEGITTEDLMEQASLNGVNLDNMQKPLDDLSAEDLDAIANEFDINI